MGTVAAIQAFFEAWAPAHLAESWDNIGLQIGDPAANISEVVIALEVDEAVLEYLVGRKNCCVITHHPLFFKPLKTIRYDQEMGQILQLFLAGNHHLFSAHTNLDAAVGGVNDSFVAKYNLKPEKGKPIDAGFGKYFENVNLDFTSISKKFPCKQQGSASSRDIQRIGFCAGSGHGFIKHVIELKLDTFITGEITYHDHVQCRMNDIRVLTLGHKESEQHSCTVILQKLKQQFSEMSYKVIK